MLNATRVHTRATVVSGALGLLALPFHMPVSAAELQAIALPLYTYGGDAGGSAP
jgi:hypothetical protein